MGNATGPGRFEGFGPDLIAFYLELAAHNERDWWHPHKDRWAGQVGRPMQALAAELETRYGRVKTFRPYRDVRFSHDKRPIDLLRRTSLTVGTHLEPGPWLSSRSAYDRIVAGWETAGRWNRWLVDHLPPATQPAVP